VTWVCLGGLGPPTSSLSVEFRRSSDEVCKVNEGVLVDAPARKRPGCCHLVLSARSADSVIDLGGLEYPEDFEQGGLVQSRGRLAVALIRRRMPRTAASKGWVKIRQSRIFTATDMRRGRMRQAGTGRWLPPLADSQRMLEQGRNMDLDQVRSPMHISCISLVSGRSLPFCP
jgi:hypothetical protein